MQPGDIIADKYRIERKLGAGGFGDVWVATQLSSGRPVAIKTVRQLDDAATTTRFEREAHALSRIEHPHCVRLLDYGVLADQRRFLVMELLDGADLDDWLRRGRPIEARLAVAQQIAEALAAAHAQGIVHRDLKPANIIITQLPTGPHAVVLDFGIAKLAGAPLLDITKTGEVFGTPGYMSPEQLRATADAGPPSDVYVLGVLIFELIEQRPPFEGSSMLELAMAHIGQPVPPLTQRDIPLALRELVPRMLAKDSRARPPLAEVIEVLRTGEASGSASTPVVRRPPRASSAGSDRNLTGVMLGLLALVAVAAIAVIALLRTDEPAPNPAPPTKVPPSALLRTTEPKPDPGAEPRPATDAGTAMQLPVKTGRCSGQLPDRSEFDFDVRVPPDYGTTEHPLLVILHDWGQRSADILSSDRLAQMTDERGMIIVAPADDPMDSPWVGPSERERVGEAIRRSVEQLCVDPKRVFLLGLGNGGNPVYRLSCRIPDLAAVATSGYRFDQDEDDCHGPHRPPYLFTNPRHDKFAPRDGGRACMTLELMTSLAEHEERVREKWGCKVKRSPERSGCFELSCKDPLRICRRRGGRLWPEFTPQDTATVAHKLCGMKPPEHDYLAEVFEFFDEFDPGPTSEPEDSPDDVEGVGHPAPK